MVIKVSAHYGIIAGVFLIAFGYLIHAYLPEDADPLKLWLGKFAVITGVLRLAISRYGTIRLNPDENIVEFRLQWLCGLSKKTKLRLSDFVDAKVEISHYSSSVGTSPRRVSLVKESGEVLPLTSYFDVARKNNVRIVDAIRELLKVNDGRLKRFRAARQP